ncbi:Thoeris anti-defense Tad2 family protein [Xenorhabdus bovienii]|uniref:Putative phage protein n=1 Tax=Xenorhabdus bovienii TaxID=40576 RepID=A0A0B6X2X5_XENBV|nr:MW1434 family type I TA system toxin [Xenorhabdus bovienii]CDM88137.1 Putative phage protein [Xenorhabdus bovienii]
MSKVNKPENNAALKCPFDPNQYHTDNEKIAVPVGSSAWALSQIFLGKQVHRSGWNAPIEHMRLAHKSEAGSADDGAAYIEKSDKDGYWSRWTPTQEDLLACDWNLLAAVCPEDSMLVFDLKSGNESGYVGYVDNQYGTLNIIQNKVGFKEILFFKSAMGSFNDMPVGYLSFKISYDIANHQTLENLLKKKLYITIDDTTYNIGHYGVFSPDDNKEEKTYKVSYEHDYPSDIDKLYKIMSQSEHSKRYYLNWNDIPSPDLNNILEFDIKFGSNSYGAGYLNYGYSGHDGVDGNGEKLGVFGTLNIIKNNTKIPDVLAFYYNGGTFFINVPYDRFNAQRIAELFEKNLYITVDDKLYKLGIPSSGDASGPANKFSIFYNIYDDSELLNLGGVLKKTGETKRLLLTWLNK